MTNDPLNRILDEQLLNSKLKDAIHIDNETGAPDYGTKAQISNFKDFCLGRQIRWEDIIVKNFPEEAHEIIEVFGKHL